MTYVEEEPRSSRTKQDLTIFPLAVVGPEVSPARLGWVEANACVLENGSAVDLIRVAFRLALHVGLCIFASLIDVTGNIKGVAGSLIRLSDRAFWAGS